MSAGWQPKPAAKSAGGGGQQLRGYRLPQCSGFPKNAHCLAAVCGGRGEIETFPVDELGGGVAGIEQDVLAHDTRLRAEKRAPYSSVGV